MQKRFIVNEQLEAMEMWCYSKLSKLACVNRVGTEVVLVSINKEKSLMRL